MTFEWDENKNIKNISKHGLDFNDAKEIFNDITRIKSPDLRMDYNEERWITIGKIADTIIVVVFVIRDSNYRIISVRYADKNERKKYNNQ